jgi:phosphate starvation-inducible PhoH-like protein
MHIGIVLGSIGVLCMPMRAVSYTSFARLPMSHAIRKSSMFLNAKKGKHVQHVQQLLQDKPVLYRPHGIRQEQYVESLQNPSVDLVFGIGPAGCGKTLFACLAAVEALKTGSVSKIVLTRPSVAADEQLGFLPGDILKKMNPMMLPLFDVFLEHFQKSEWDRMISSGVIEIAPIGFMRGRTFKNCFVIADEMQNSTPNQMLMLLTRIGTGTKMVVTGDLLQSDIRSEDILSKCGENGLQDVIDRIYTKSGCDDSIQVVMMNDDDVERSDIVKRVLELYK